MNRTIITLGLGLCLALLLARESHQGRLPEGQCFGPNEEYTKCPSKCSLNCFNKDNPPKCEESDCLKPGCACMDGFVRNHNGFCIRPEHCKTPESESKGGHAARAAPNLLENLIGEDQMNNDLQTTATTGQSQVTTSTPVAGERAAGETQVTKSVQASESTTGQGQTTKSMSILENPIGGGPAARSVSEILDNVLGQGQGQDQVTTPKSTTAQGRAGEENVSKFESTPAAGAGERAAEQDPVTKSAQASESTTEQGQTTKSMSILENPIGGGPAARSLSEIVNNVLGEGQGQDQVTTPESTTAQGRAGEENVTKSESTPTTGAALP